MKQVDPQQSIDKIVLATGNISRPYIVRDIAFAMNTIDFPTFNATKDPNELFTIVIQQLKEKALEYSADALINCHFSYAHEQMNPEEPIVRISAYGTIVQFRNSTIGG
ncbi:hypothetical protein [Enterococcus sp.]|uniref:hypothetical protein n=1 Tax=Enterococcus sp. TaxID=35783 RepID=UPI002FC69F5C